jgi:biopolymer transport protein ExbD
MKHRKQIQRIEKKLNNRSKGKEAVILIRKDGKYYYNDKELSQKEYNELKQQEEEGTKDIITLVKA